MQVNIFWVYAALIVGCCLGILIVAMCMAAKTDSPVIVSSADEFE